MLKDRVDGLRFVKRDVMEWQELLDRRADVAGHWREGARWLGGGRTCLIAGKMLRCESSRCGLIVSNSKYCDIVITISSQIAQ